MHFQFRATRSNGEKINNRIEARHQREAQSLLESRGLSHIELTEIDGPPPRATNAIDSAAGAFLKLILFLAIGVAVVWGGGSLLYNMDLSSPDEDSEETASTPIYAEPTRPERSSIPIEQEPEVEQPRQEVPAVPVAPARPAFNPDLVRGVLKQVINGDNTLREIRDQFGVMKIWGWARSVSIRRGTEIGYDYDVIVNFRSVFEFYDVDGRRRGDPQITEGHLTFHVTSDYRLSELYGCVSNDANLSFFPQAAFETVNMTFEELRKRQ